MNEWMKSEIKNISIERDLEREWHERRRNLDGFWKRNGRLRTSWESCISGWRRSPSLWSYLSVSGLPLIVKLVFWGSNKWYPILFEHMIDPSVRRIYWHNEIIKCWFADLTKTWLLNEIINVDALHGCRFNEDLANPVPCSRCLPHRISEALTKPSPTLINDEGDIWSGFKSLWPWGGVDYDH